MPKIDLRVTEQDWRAIRKHCASSFRGKRDTELGALALLSERKRADGDMEYLVAKVLWPEAGDVENSNGMALTFKASYIRRAHLAARSAGLSGIATFHTHPFATSKVGFSGYDDSEDPLLIENLQDIWSPTVLLSVVLGSESQKGRVWRSPKVADPLDHLVVVGESLQWLGLDGLPPSGAPSPAATFDRAMSVTGSGALACLSHMTVVVVGASGTGSLMCELLARAGCGRIILIDFDALEDGNLNRVLHSTWAHTKAKTKKVYRIADAINGLGLPTVVVPIEGSILDRNVVARLCEADLIVGCVDKALPRMLLCQYAYQNLVPYIDLGTEIGGNDEGIVSTDTRVNYVAPGRPCLRCTGLVTARALQFESVVSHERKRIADQGYSADLLLKQPAVMDLNMLASGSAMLIVRHLLQPFLDTPLPVTVSTNMVMYSMRKTMKARAYDESCNLCGKNPLLGYGDKGKAIGLDPGQAALLR